MRQQAGDNQADGLRFANPTSQAVGGAAAVARAFGTWQAAGVGLASREVTQNGDIVVDWRSAKDPDHSMVGNTLAHSDFPPGFSIITTALPLPLHFDDTVMLGQVAAASWGPNRLDVFALQRNGNVLQLWWDGSWHWSNLGNGFTGGTRFAGPLTAASWGNGRLDVFGLSPSGDVLQLWFNGEWHWSNLGNGFSGDLFAGLTSASSWGANRLDVYGLGQTGNVLQLWWNGQHWTWSNLGPLQ